MRPVSKVLEPTTIEAERPRNGERAAVIICHGMGQQLKWQTLCQLVSSLDRAGKVTPVGEAGVRQVRFKEDGHEFMLGRAEFSTPDAGGDTKDIHIYEAYWAPLTEGKVSLLQTVGFLLRAGISGIAHSTRTFFRYGRFGEDRIKPFTPPRSLILTFALALAVVLALLVMNVSISVRQVRELVSDAETLPRNESLLAALTGDLWTFELVALAYAGLMAAVVWRRSRRRERDCAWVVPTGVQAVLWAGLALLLGATIAIGLGAVPAHYLVHATLSQDGQYVPGAPEHALLRAPAEAAQAAVARAGALLPAGARPLSALEAHALLVWGLVIVAGYLGRGLLIEYAGDVAIYVTSQRLSTFDQVREEIKKLARRVVCAVCAQGGYERVIIVGHSLGSVVAYDALNGTMLADEITGLYHVERVRRLITFGSPLDKTAFIFRAADAGNAPVREGLAASVQPIMIYPPSPGFDWINIHSKNDIISGALDFYPGVKDVPDAQADVPVLAHVQFWNNVQLANAIGEACVDPFRAHVPVAKRYEQLVTRAAAPAAPAEVASHDFRRRA